MVSSHRLGVPEVLGRSPETDRRRTNRMPTYQYVCTEPECGSRFELVQSFTDPAASECPVCTGSVRKVFSSVGVVFKGSGFYRNDSREAAKSSSTSSSNGSKDSKDSKSSSASGSASTPASTGSSTSTTSTPSATPSSTAAAAS